MVPLSPVYLVPLGFVAYGSPLFGIGLASQRKNAAVLRWPRVRGRIVSSTLQSRQVRSDQSTGVWSVYETVFSVDARFAYEVDGRTYEATTISRAGLGNERKEVEGWVHRHPVGAEVSVYVDPANPATAYLQWSRSVGAIILLVWGGVFIFIGLLVFTIFLIVGG